MRKIREYNLNKVFIESGKKQSFAMPVDCHSVRGLFIIPQFPDILIPNNVPFLIGNISVLLNNKNENTLHNYPLYACPDKNNKFSLGNEYSLDKKIISLSTPVKPGSLITFIFKDSGYMRVFKDALPLIYGGFDYNIDINLIYDDESGDWSKRLVKNNSINK